MKRRAYATLILALFAAAANAQPWDSTGQMLFNRMLEGEARQRALVQSYIQDQGESLWFEYTQGCEQLGGYCIPFEQFALLKLKQQAGIDPNIEHRLAMSMHQQFIQGQDAYFRAGQDAHRSLQESYDRSNRAWQDDQRTLDQLSADRAAVMRGNWAFSNGYSEDAVTLPHAPEVGQVYYDDSGNYYRHNGFNWIQYDNENLEGPGLIMQPLPNVEY